MAPKTKSRVAVRLKEAVRGGSKTKNRSGDLVALTQTYNDMKLQLRTLIAALKNNHAAMLAVQKTRFEVAKQVAAISMKSPLYDHAGALPTPERQVVLSYASVHSNMASKSTSYADKYNSYVISYATEWQKVITTRIDASLKEAEVYRRDLNHYQTKVESLRQATNTVMAKGKIVDPKQAAKLGRNEEKLLSSRQGYENFCNGLCALIEEVTEGAWKDLHPLLVKLCQFDATMGSEENKAFASLNTVVDQLKRIGDQNGLKPSARLKELETLQPTSYRIEERQKENDNNSQTDVLSPASSASFDDRSTGSSYAMTRNSIFNRSSSSLGASQQQQPPPPTSAPGSSSTLDMLAIASAAPPPPTMEMVRESTNNLSFGTGSHSGSYNDLSSFGFQSSDNSIPVAPAPSAPPPPPPPNMNLSMYPELPVASAVPMPASSPHPWSNSSSSSSGFAQTNPFANTSSHSTASSSYAPPSMYGTPYAPPPLPSYAAPPAPYAPPQPVVGRRLSSNPFDD